MKASSTSKSLDEANGTHEEPEKEDEGDDYNRSDTKKQKLDIFAPQSTKKESNASVSCFSSSEKKTLKHPHGVKPIGNYYADVSKGIKECRRSGLGLLSLLSDAQCLSFFGFFTPNELIRLGEISRALYVFANHDELWRAVVLEGFGGEFEVRSTWKASYIATKQRHSASSPPSSSPLQVEGFYSDLLFQPFYCATVPIDERWLQKETIDRCSITDLSLSAFKTQYEATNRPVILTKAINHWPALTKWTDEYLISTCGDTKLIAGGFEMRMDQYLHYSRTLLDDQPLFIFDKHFASKLPSLAQDYTVPSYFQQDFFQFLGPDHRPDYRWLIIGPERSGSSFHVDPNATNAWNAVIRGAKKWILFPPDVIPPGVHPSEDGGDVSTPVSLMEWFVTFYPQIKKLPLEKQPLEGICRAGEVIFVPNGWWHLVLNIEDSIAITQNFVCDGNVKNVLRFLKNKPDQVSGCALDKRTELYGRFHQELEKEIAPETIAKIDLELEKEDELRRNPKKTKWEQLLEGNQANVFKSDTQKASSSTSSASFGFGFGFDFD